jgi:MarR family transcriptional regulator for hemolysin
MEIKDITTAERCAVQLLDIVPVIMRYIRVEMRRSRGYDMTVPQFRTLAYLSSNQGSSLSGLAEHIGLTLPSASKMVDLLVARELVERIMCTEDRRRVKLSLTANGWAAWAMGYQAAKAYLAKKMSQLSEEEQEKVAQMMTIIKPLFITEQH